VIGRTLITGADGYLGRRLAARLLADTDDALVLTVRAVDAGELAAKKESLRRGLRGADARIQVLPADMRDPDPFAAFDVSGVTCVVHAAARTAFNVERTVAREVNLNGTVRVGELARRCPKLERLLVLSTLYSAGRQVGTVEEVPHQHPGVGSPAGVATAFVNFYEWSKCEAERHLLATCGDLPLAIARLATIVADDESGAVTQYNAFHNTLKLFFYGLLSLMPGDPKTPLYLTTADFTSRGVAHLMRPEVPAGIYHLTPGPGETATLGELVDLSFDVFERDPAFVRRRLLRPEFCDIESFRDLVAASLGLSASPMRQALASVAPFAEQMFLPKDFDNSRLRATWAGYPETDPRGLAEATCARLVETRWGRTSEETTSA
jgi:nucleoside-diphosphate-sugar epimerase